MMNSPEVLCMSDVNSNILNAIESLDDGELIARVHNDLCLRQIRYVCDSVWEYVNEEVNYKYYSIWDAQCSMYLGSGFNSSSQLECADDGIIFLMCHDKEEQDPVVQEALLWSLKDKISFLYGSDLIVEGHDIKKEEI